MISDEHQLIFIHIPKSAGFSVREFIRVNLNGIYNVDAYPNYTRDLHPMPLGLRYTHMTLNEHMNQPGTKRTSYRKLGFVRNPWDRLASGYEWRKWFHLPRYQFSSFAEMIDRIDTGWDFEDDDERHTLKQVDFLKGPDGKIAANFVGKFETLQADFSQAMREFGIAHDPHLPVTNQSKVKEHSDYRDYYTPAMRDKVARVFEEDIDTFKYTF